MATKDMETISFDGGINTYRVIDSTALHSTDVVSTYSSTGTSPINGTGVAIALANKLSGEQYGTIVIDI